MPPTGRSQIHPSRKETTVGRSFFLSLNSSGNVCECTSTRPGGRKKEGSWTTKIFARGGKGTLFRPGRSGRGARTHTDDDEGFSSAGDVLAFRFLRARGEAGKSIAKTLTVSGSLLRVKLLQLQIPFIDGRLSCP